MFMEWSRNRKWLTIALIGIIIPVSLLVTFKLTGILPSLTIAETFTADAVNWNMERPNDNFWLRENVENSYRSEEVLVRLNIFLDGYSEYWLAYGGRDLINMNVSMTANVHDGWVERAYFVFHASYNQSIVVISSPDKCPGMYSMLENLSITDWGYGIFKEERLKEGVNAFIDTVGTANPSRAYFNCPVDWVFKSPNNQTETLEIAVEITYFNGTAYKKAVLPMTLNTVADTSCSFETAENITAGTYQGYLDSKDQEDYYKIWMENGQTIQAQMIPPFQTDFDLYLYNPQRKLAASSEIRGDETEQIAFTADSTGWWYIKTLARTSNGKYTLQVRVV